MDQPKQVLPRKAYTSEAWFDRERENLFGKTWHFVCMAFELAEPGDFQTLNLFGYPIFVIRSQSGELLAFHNLCRHRGTELLEGNGNAGKTLVCPYHRWTYGLDGRLRGIPDKETCFPGFVRDDHNLMAIGVGVFKEMVFINLGDPDGTSFNEWIGKLRGYEWPHEITGAKLKASDEFVYEINCNWKVFFENAIDGYHLAYLHEKTLGGPHASENIWESFGHNMVWYSTERDGVKNRIPKFVEEQAGFGASKITEADTPGYGGVYMLFPTTLVTPSPWSLTISAMRPISSTQMRFHAKTWVSDNWLSYKEKPDQAPGYDPKTKTIQSKNWKMHPLETGDFQTEDIWVCEKMQRSLSSPAYSVGQLACGSGGEAAIETFQRNVLDYVGN